MMLRDGFHQFKNALSDLFFPPVCGFCEAVSVESGAPLCENCLDSIEEISGPICIQCGLPIPGLSPLTPAGTCGRCLADPPKYKRARYGVYYQGTVRDALLRFKFAGALHTASALSLILTEAFRRHFESGDFDLIVPVPIHRTRLIHRGFNQVVELGKRLSRDTGIALDRASFQKVKDTVPQVGLTRAARVKNLRGSFGVRRPDRIRGRNILLVDDVTTTGSTIAEASKTIMRAGASRVDVLVLSVRMEVSTRLERDTTLTAPEHPISNGMLPAKQKQ